MIIWFLHFASPLNVKRHWDKMPWRMGSLSSEYIVAVAARIISPQHFTPVLSSSQSLQSLLFSSFCPQIWKLSLGMNFLLLEQEAPSDEEENLRVQRPYNGLQGWLKAGQNGAAKRGAKFRVWTLVWTTQQRQERHRERFIEKQQFSPS